jgi:hypothetical protein
MIISTHGSHPRLRQVGHIRAVSVDWQPRPRDPNPGCAAPPGSTVMASTPDANVTQDGMPAATGPLGFEGAPSIAYMGGLRKDGRERLLERFVGNNVDSAEWVKSAVLAAPYAALVAHSEDEHYGGSSDSVQMFDLRSGVQRKDLGGEAAGCPGYIGGWCSTLDEIVLGSDGVSAAHWQTVVSRTGVTSSLDAASCAPASTLCVAVDPVLDDLLTANDPSAGRKGWTSGKLFAAVVPITLTCPSQSLCVGAFLTGLQLTGDTLSWSHDGSRGRSS